MKLPQKRERQRSGIQRGVQREWPRHRKFIRSLACVCAELPFKDGFYWCDGPIACCHLRLGTHGPMADKPHDWFTFPGCAIHHEEAHKGEASFQAKYNLDLRAICLALARQSPDTAMREAMRLANVE